MAAGALAQPKLHPLVCNILYACSSDSDTVLYDLVPVGNEGGILHVVTEPANCMWEIDLGQQGGVKVQGVEWLRCLQF